MTNLRTAALAGPCPCGDRPADQCPGEWEPGCDLGNNPKYAKQAEPKGGGNLPPPLQVPTEVVATLTTTDIAWLETRRLTKIWQELGQMRWAGADEGWDRAIEAVRSRINDECQAVMYWKLTADKSQATAVELLQKMRGVKDD